MKAIWSDLMYLSDTDAYLDMASQLLTDLINYAASAATPPCHNLPNAKSWWNNEI